MAKSKKSKILATALCTAVMTGLYAAPVMAGDASYSADGSGITINISENKTGDNGIYTVGPGGLVDYRVSGKITISANNMVTALEGKSFNELTIGGQTFNSTQINAFKQDYQQLKDKVDGLAPGEDLKPRVEALESKVSVQNGQVVLKNGSNVGVLVGTGITSVAAGGSKIALNKADNTVVTSVNGMEVIKTNVDGTTFKTTREEDGVTSINGGTVTAASDVVANGTSLVTVGSKTAALENKTTAIEYTPGSTDPNAPAYQKMGTTTIKDKLKADIFSANQGTIGGVTMVGGTINTGKFAVDNNGNVTLDGTVNGVELKNGTISAANGKFTVDEYGVADANVLKAHSVIFDGGSISATGISAVNGKFVVDANGTVKSFSDVQSANYSLENLGKSFDDLETGVSTDLSELKQKTAGISKPTSGTTLVEGVSFGGGRINADGGIIGDVELIDGKVNGVDVVQVRDTVARNVIDINALQQKTAGIVKTTSGTTVVEGVSFGQGAIDAKSGIIGDVSIADGKVDGVDVSQLRDSVAGNIVDVSDLKRKTTDIEYKDGVTEIGKGALVVNNEGYVSINNGMITADADSGYVTMGKGIEFDTDNGIITAKNVHSENYDLESVGSQLDNLEGTVGETNKNVAGIKREGETTIIEDTLSISKEFVGAKIESSIFGITDEDVTIAHGSNGIAINNKGINLSGNVYFEGKDGNSYTLGDLEERVSNLEDKTQNITGSKPGTGEGGSTVPPTGDGHTGIEGDVTVGGNINVGGNVTAGEGSFTDKVTVGGENGTTIDGNGMTVGDTIVGKDGVNVGGEEGTFITDNDVVINKGTENEVSLSDVGNRVDNLEQGMVSMNNRISKVEDRIDKVGAMSAAIANLRSMGYDPAAPTEVAVGVGQYRSETGVALGMFHYPNQDFMLSLSVSTSGDEVMGGIGATWKFGRKTPEQMLQAEQEKAAKAKVAKAMAMKVAAEEAKVKAQQAKHAKMAAEKAAK